MSVSFREAKLELCSVGNLLPATKTSCRNQNNKDILPLDKLQELNISATNIYVYIYILYIEESSSNHIQ